MKVKIKLLHPDAKIPFKKHKSDACYDVFAVSKKYLDPYRVEYDLGFALQLPPEAPQLDLRARSSIHKTGMILSNGIGTGDHQYCGCYKAVFYKIIKELPDYEAGDRILQIQVPGNIDLEFELVDELDETERGEGGFGSTGGFGSEKR